MNRLTSTWGFELKIIQDESSQFGSSESDITSLSSSILDYEYENGRRYHSNRAVYLIWSTLKTTLTWL